MTARETRGAAPPLAAALRSAALALGALAGGVAAAASPAGAAPAGVGAAASAAATRTGPTPPVLPAPFATPSATKFSKVVGWPEGVTPQAPAGFAVKAFARGLDNPRNLLVLPNGDVLVAESRTVRSPERNSQLPPEVRARLDTRPSANRITLLRDTDRDGVADVRTVLLEGLNQPFGMAVRRDRLYVANTDAVISCPFFVGTAHVKGGCRPLFDLPAGGYENHWTRNLAFSADEAQLFVAVGSATNVDEERIDGKDPRRAAILAARPDGKDVQVFASGLRNPVGLAIEPVTGRLWTTVNERDGLGDDLVPDFMTAVRRGAFYGWPYSDFGVHEDPRRKGERPDLVAKAVVPDFAFDAHTASLGLAFYRRDTFPKRYRGGAFVAQRGSWNRSGFAGYRVVFVPFANGRPSGDEEDFLTGFVKDAQAGEVYGRPAGVAAGKDGALLVADDAGDTVWHVQTTCKACLPDPEPARRTR
ncbi:MAG: PQQ-dependent sugar dehydrogenase [Pseudomonadota bacterium]